MLFEAIEKRYQLTLPETYQSMQQQGWCSVENYNQQQPLQSLYLYLPDAEWWPLDRIFHYQPPAYHQPGFVPFADNGAGDLWSWWPERATGLETPIVFCPHDYMLAYIDAPNFTGWLYRRVLDYAAGHITETETEAQVWLKLWLDRLSPFWPQPWQDTIRTLCTSPLKTWGAGIYQQQGFITPEEYQTIVTRDLTCPGLNEEFRWMT